MSLIAVAACGGGDEPAQSDWPAKTSEVSPDEPTIGRIVVSQGDYPTTNTGTFAATFGVAAVAAPLTTTRSTLSDCDARVIDGCLVETCRAGSVPVTPSIRASSRAESGPITVRGMLGRSFELNPPYYSGQKLSERDRLFESSGGDRVEVTGAGGFDVPSFSVGVAAPSSPVVTLDPEHVELEVVRGQPWTRAWPATPADDKTLFDFELRKLNPSGERVTIECHAHASAGAITIPATVTSRLLAGSDGIVEVRPRVEERTRAGAYEINVVLVGAPCWSALRIAN